MTIEQYKKTYDPTGQFDVLVNSFRQAQYSLDQEIDIGFKKNEFNAVIVSGMGGSAISADILRNFLRDELKLPFIVNRSYNLPSFAGENTLVIISSYSGNTEESVSVLKQAVEKKCSIAALTTGGEVEKICISRKLPYLVLEKGYQPRYSLGQGFFMLLRLLEHLRVIPVQQGIIEKIRDQWKHKGIEFQSEGNAAIIYAQQLVGFIPIIYSAQDFTDAAGYRFKCQLNENSKLHAFHNVIPELNHNEIIGWESFRQKDMRGRVINLLDRSYPEQVKKRFNITSSLITAKETEIINLESREEDFKLRLFDLIYLTDWISYYLAVLRGFDPVEIEYINLLKRQLS